MSEKPPQRPQLQAEELTQEERNALDEMMEAVRANRPPKSKELAGLGALGERPQGKGAFVEAINKAATEEEALAIATASKAPEKPTP